MKQAIVARTDIGMGTGKLAAQVAHASLKAYEDAEPDARREWKAGGQKKIVLKGSGETQLRRLADGARRERLPHAVVSDAGHTQLDPGTVTTLAVGPGPENIVDKVTGDLSLY
ncbi:peptidyl-tRNA hydrolase [Natronomonas moolapensis 8.8.11]|jgi:PTH2 family peptidyl-tRNA hydrolase|uniref:Peptidyl-tRNA hydrolase n=1 Tax=Natronomonas moolapensis (strain DSM 18674 / CECT 7526 / JCM 14361 / 8.8.11) TaxID=268739 RepID=M1XPX2_NATM8|nr:peptidyl-tRNA hydrolase Pth2 [Natronomonas moolapensis]CCQ36081.1 peptidyl-tRNA hydrolase [Natronomonas moolapensis 8.8.11]